MESSEFYHSLTLTETDLRRGQSGFAGKQSLVGRSVPISAVLAFLGCLVVSWVLHTPVPRIHDEFSYLLLGETLASGHITNPSPPLPEFFDSFHVLMRPVHVSKYFPAQGIFLAIAERVNGHPEAGVWLIATLACAATAWMLQAWLNPAWGLLGGLLMVIEFGVFSYWSQSYWGGMVPALGGALAFGAIRRLWDRSSWQNSFWLGLGLVILGSSRPLEGLIAVSPVGVLFVVHLYEKRSWRDAQFWSKAALPCFVILACGAFALGAYNRAITGSAFKAPYALHEEQYQESPPFIFMPLRPKHTYSSPILQFYYEIYEMRPYVTQRVPKWFITGMTRKLTTWWEFYCGLILTVPLVLPGLLQKGRIRLLQGGVLAAFVALSFLSTPTAVFVRAMLDLLVLAQIVLLWKVFDDKWSRLAILTCSLLELELLFAKWEFPHYFAPAACLVLYLEVEGLRRIWKWTPQVIEPDRSLTRSERRRMARENQSRRKPAFNLRWVVYIIPVACFFSLCMRVYGRLNGWPDDPHGIARGALLTDDWSLDRANIDKWLEQQPKPQIVFVRYWQNHNINFEWIYNHPDIMHSHVIWARDLGTEHNKLLLNILADRTVWLIEADRKHPQLVPYEDAIDQAHQLVVQGTALVRTKY